MHGAVRMLRDGHDLTPPFDQLDSLRHRIFPAVLHGLKAKAVPVHMRVCGRFSGVISANLRVSFIKRSSRVPAADSRVQARCGWVHH
jgi:hypothetical protein